MSKIIERIVVSDYPPKSDSLWIDTSSDVPKLKITFDHGEQWLVVGSGNNNL